MVIRDGRPDDYGDCPGNDQLAGFTGGIRQPGAQSAVGVGEFKI